MCTLSYIMRTWLLALPALLAACADPTEVSEQGSGAIEVVAEPTVCASLNVFGRDLQLFTRADGTTVLRTDARAKDVGDAMNFATLAINAEVVLQAASVDAAKRQLTTDANIWAAILDEPNEPNLAPDAILFRLEKAKLFANALQCAPGAPEEAIAPEPVCVQAPGAVPEGSPFLTVTKGPEYTGQWPDPERRSSFVFTYQSPHRPIAGSTATVAWRRSLLLEHLKPGADGIDYARQILNSPTARVDSAFLGRLAYYRPLDESLVCTP